MIERILIANRGEIAVRIIRTCKVLGIETVAVYSQPDAEALHVILADEAVCIGGARAADSYLHMNNLVQAAISTGCDAIHPGFGFLSENAVFARLVEACGLIFIGPSPAVIEAMGDKSHARSLMQKAGIPIIPGSQDLIPDWKSGLETAREIGFPVMIKASAGGGGKGMRLSQSSEDFEESFLQAQSESRACFGQDGMYLEKYISHPKHVEIQIAADRFGHAVHFYERDCSFQVHHQKMIEESPCPVLRPDIREQMCQAALTACRISGFDSVGTIEYLLDDEGRYYFMEMNTRIQVEHPVTEMLTGLDLIALQIQIANQNPLPLHQQDIHAAGHVMECRINAQDAARGLRPSCGLLSFLHLPGGKDVRIDTSIYPGWKVTPFYDPMLCKIIVSGKNRKECMAKMMQALEEFTTEGVETNEDFLHFCLGQPDIVSGSYDTAYASACLQGWMKHEPDPGA